MLKEVQMNVAQDLPEASHFYSMQITNGVFAAFPMEGFGAISNTGVGEARFLKISINTGFSWNVR